VARARVGMDHTLAGKACVDVQRVQQEHRTEFNDVRRLMKLPTPAFATGAGVAPVAGPLASPVGGACATAWPPSSGAPADASGSGLCFFAGIIVHTKVSGGQKIYPRVRTQCAGADGRQKKIKHRQRCGWGGCSTAVGVTRGRGGAGNGVGATELN